MSARAAAMRRVARGRSSGPSPSTQDAGAFVSRLAARPVSKTVVVRCPTCDDGWKTCASVAADDVQREGDGQKDGGGGVAVQQVASVAPRSGSGGSRAVGGAGGGDSDSGFGTEISRVARGGSSGGGDEGDDEGDQILSASLRCAPLPWLSAAVAHSRPADRGRDARRSPRAAAVGAAPLASCEPWQRRQQRR